MYNKRHDVSSFQTPKLALTKGEGHWDYRRLTDAANKALFKGSDPEGYELGISPID